MSRAYDRFMVDVGIGTNRKLRRLPVAQRWVYVAGVLALAAQSPIRGALLITDGEPATDQDVAEEATVPVKDARAALESLRGLGMIERDVHGVEWVHDWDGMNPEPKPSDSPEATRERKRKQRAATRGHAHVPRDMGVTSAESHAPEVKGRKETPQPPAVAGGGRAGISVVRTGRERDKARFEREVAETAARLFPGADVRKAHQCVRQAVKWLGNDADGPVTDEAVRAYADQWWPELTETKGAA